MLNQQLVLEKFVRRLYFVEGGDSSALIRSNDIDKSVINRRDEIKFSSRTAKNKFLSMFKK